MQRRGQVVRNLVLLHSVIKHHSSVQDFDDEYFDDDDDDKEEHTEAQFFQAHFLDMESFESAILLGTCAIELRKRVPTRSYVAFDVIHRSSTEFIQ